MPATPGSPCSVTPPGSLKPAREALPLQKISHQNVKGPGKLETAEGGGELHPETPQQQTNNRTTPGLWVCLDWTTEKGLNSLCPTGD